MPILFDEPFDVYHASGAIGSGAARDFLRSPRLYADRIAGLRRPESSALVFGVAAHCLLLEPEHFSARVVVRPDGHDGRTKAGRAWLAENGGRASVSAAEFADLSRMRERMPDEVRVLFRGCAPEVTIRTHVDVDGVSLPVQARPDVYRSGCIPDLKTVDSIERAEASIYRYGYHIQAAWYRMVALRETGARHDFRLVFVEKQPPHRWRIYDLDAEYRMLGDEAVDRALIGIAARTKSGRWDDDGEVCQVASPPLWAITDDETEE